MLKLVNVSAKYGELFAIRNVNLEVNEGEILALIGPNGAGKTTTLKVISGLLEAAEGEIEFNNVKLNNIPAEKRVRVGITQILERRGIFHTMTVLENLEMGAYTLDTDIEENIQKVYELFPIMQERKNQNAGTLSGGEQQMLAIARGLMSNPKLLLLDEPSLGLASIVRKTIARAIQELNHLGVTILLAEQNASMALDLSNRTYVLEMGKITREGKSSDLMQDERIKQIYLGID